MNKKIFVKKIIVSGLLLALPFSIAGCSLFDNKENMDLKNRPTISDIAETGDYILGDSTGKIALYNSSHEEIDSVNLKSNKKSDFIYTADNGSVYAAEVVSTAADEQIIYALDKGNNRVYMLSVKGDKIEEIESKSVKDSNIENIYAYNGTFFYSVISEKRSANSATYKKVESEQYNGVINYNASLPQPLPSKNSTYIVTINFVDEYLEEMGYDNLSSYSESNMSLGPEDNTETYQIPCEANNWIADGDYIYFFYDERMGQYDMKKNEIGLYYGPHYTIDSDLQDGLDGGVFTLSNFGSEDSTKGLVFELNLYNMNVKNIIEIDNPNILDISVDRSGYIVAVVKNDGDKYFSTVKIFNQETMEEALSIPLTYVPSQVESHNGKAYLFNSMENYFIVVDLSSGNVTEIPKEVDGINYDVIIPVNSLKIDRYLYNSSGKYINEDGIEMLADGTLINNKKQKINKYMQLIDENGRAIDSNGNFIDLYNNIIDENGNIIDYVMGPDGYYRDSKGNLVNQDGVPLVQDEDGNWIDPTVEVDEPITGHYDENGEFVIDEDYLERHPDAYSKLEETPEQN